MMIIGITGTPGTGKTTVAKELAKKLNMNVVNVNTLAEKVGAMKGYDRERGCYIVNVEKLENALQKLKFAEKDVIVEGHLAHFVRVDVLFVLRCRPDVLRKRLEEKGWNERKIRENVEAEILDVVVQEAYHSRKWRRAYELDTTFLTPEKVVELMVALMRKDVDNRNYELGSVNWNEDLEKLVDERE